MISKDTILSIFNEKGTLLKWLQKLEKAYTGAELTNVEITQATPLTAIFTFLFKDGTNVKSSPITLLEGPAGPAGKDGTNGTNGVDGNGIVSIVAGAPYVAGDKTITPVTIETDESTENLTVQAQNGVNGTNGADGFIQHIGQYNKNDDGSITILVFKRHNDTTDTTLKKGSYVMIVDQYNYKDSIIGLVPEYIGEDIPFTTRSSIEIPVTDFDIANYTLRLRGKDGIAGTDGVGIESITTLGYRAGSGANIGYTETMLKAHMTDNTDKEFSTFAKDGQAVAPEFGFVEFENMPESTVIKYINKSGIEVSANSPVIKPQLNTPIMVNIAVEGLLQLRFLDANDNAYLEGTEVIIINSNNTVKTYNFVPDFISSLSLTPGHYMIIITPRTATTVGKKYLKVALRTPQ